MEKGHKTLQYFFGHLNDSAKCFRSKTFSTSLNGVSWEAILQSAKVLPKINFTHF